MIQKMLDDNPPCPVLLCDLWPHRCCSCELWTSFLTKLETRVFRQAGIQSASPETDTNRDFQVLETSWWDVLQKTQRLLCFCLDVLCSLIRADAAFGPILSSSLFIAQKTTVLEGREDVHNNQKLDGQMHKTSTQTQNQSQNDRKFQVLLTNEQT